MKKLTVEQIKELLNNSQEEIIKKLQDVGMVENNGLWPQKGDEYWIIDYFNKISNHGWRDTKPNFIDFEYLNLYKTHEEAEADGYNVIRFREIYYKYLRLIQRLNTEVGEEIDWSNFSQFKYHLAYDYERDSIIQYNFDYSVKSNNNKHYCLNNDLLGIALKEIGEEDLVFMFERM